MPKSKKLQPADKFLKSSEGKSEYDKEVSRLRESRIRFNQWTKEQTKRNYIRNDRGE